MTTQKAEKENISALLLFPCLRLKQALIDQFGDYGFVNTYLVWEKYDYPFNVIYVMFKPKRFTLGFHLFVLNMEKHVTFVETIDAPDTVVMVYRVPAKFDTDYLLFLNGAYSLTSPGFKSCFQLQTYKTDENGVFIKNAGGGYYKEDTIYHHIFNKTDYLRKKWLEQLGENTRIPKGAELYEKCDLIKETITL